MTKNLPFKYEYDYCRWMYQNCDRCSKSGDVSIPGSSSCEIFESIHDAAAGIDIPDEVARRFGTINSCGVSIFQDCPERIEIVHTTHGR